MTADGAGELLTLTIDGTEPPSAETVKELTSVCEQAEDRSGRAVLTVRVTGAARQGWTRGMDVALVTKWERAVRRLERLPVATVAVASGDVGGTALDALLATDIRIADPATRLLLPLDGEVGWPGMAAFRLVQQAGAARVRRAVLFGQPIVAARALDLGLVDELAEDPAAVAETLAREVGGRSGKELAIRRQLLFDATTTSFEDALGSHLAACDRALRRGGPEEAR